MALILIDPAFAAVPPDVQQLLKLLPPCSILHHELEHGIYGDGVEKQYMHSMRVQGVQRVLLQVNSIWRDSKTTHMEVVHHLYFDRIDGADSQILDREKLGEIKQSGLEAELDNVARERVMQAPVYAGFQGVKHPDGKDMYSYVEFFANPWLPEQKVLVSPQEQHGSQLAHSATIGDASGIRLQLKSGHYHERELTRALFEAVLSRYDNTTVIDLLLKAGANANAHGPDERTPLMNAVEHPCNIRPLLKHGVQLNGRDEWGETALRLAEAGKYTESVRLLTEAGAQ